MSSEYSNLSEKLISSTQQLTNHIKENLSSIDDATKLLPLLVAAATILAMVNLKNGDLATRFRNNAAEARKHGTEADRKLNLIEQNKWLFARYIMTSASFVSISIAMICFSLFGARSLSSYVNNLSETLNVIVGICLFFFGLLILSIEFSVGWYTLYLDRKT